MTTHWNYRAHNRHEVLTSMKIAMTHAVGVLTNQENARFFESGFTMIVAPSHQAEDLGNEYADTVFGSFELIMLQETVASALSATTEAPTVRETDYARYFLQSVLGLDSGGPGALMECRRASTHYLGLLKVLGSYKHPTEQ